MKRIKSISLFLISTTLMLFLFTTCSNEKGIPDYNNYPTDIGKLISTKCATAGCHNDLSKDAAGGLSLESWNKLFEGGKGNVCVIPYRADYSTLCYYTNTFSDMGTISTPSMPYNKPNLTRAEVQLLRNWINAGAPDINGFVKFSDNPNRKKIYVVNQGCDVVTVLDEATLLPMRYITVGSSAGIESPHMIRVSPDGEYWYIIFLAGNYLEKYRTSDDSFVGRALIGAGYWNSFSITSNSNTAYCMDLSGSNAKIATVDLTTMSASVQAGFSYPHGSALNNTDDTLYVTQQVGSSKIYKIPTNDFSSYSEVNLFTTTPPTPLNSHDIKFTPDGTKYFVTCQGTSEVRVFETGSDQLLETIPVGAMPSEMSFSASTNNLFVTCTEDTLSFPGKRGSIAIIDYTSNTLKDIIYAGHQPHGIEVDDVKKLVYVINRNVSSDGPAPHHSSQCGGRNGYLSIIDLNTLKAVTQTHENSIKKIEISVDPYSVSTRR
jgi:DNA-binding beta-propeller fold protein YncE